VALCLHTTGDNGTLTLVSSPACAPCWLPHTTLLKEILFCGLRGGGAPTGWPHTAQPICPGGPGGGGGDEAKPDQLATPNTPIPEVPSAWTKKAWEVKMTHAIGATDVAATAFASAVQPCTPD
jgi:hypothetical protein